VGKFLRVVLIAPLVGVLALIAIGTAFPASKTPSPTPDGPPATVDDVYVALTTALGGATPDFETQVKPVLGYNFTYAELQNQLASGNLRSIVTPTAAPIAPKQAPPAQPTRAPAVATAVPIAARTVTLTQVLNVIRSEWDQQPHPLCAPSADCPPAPALSQLSAMTCDHTGDITVPAQVSCTYTDPGLGPKTLPITIDANNVVIWIGCSPPGFHVFMRDCVQAAPTPAPVVVPPPANAPPVTCGGRGYINVSVTDFSGHPVEIRIDGRTVGNNIVNGYVVNVGSHSVQFVHFNGTSTVQSGYVADCKSWTIRGG